MIYRDSEALALKEPGGRQTHDPKGAGSLISALRGMCGGVVWGGMGSGGSGETSSRKGLIPSRPQRREMGLN